MKHLLPLVLASLLTASLCAASADASTRASTKTNTPATASSQTNNNSSSPTATTNGLLGGTSGEATGRQIMHAIEKSHMAFPAVFERQSMILVDARGNRETRKLRRYSRINRDGSGQYLLLLDSPNDVAGVALLASRSPDGAIKRQLYLPALGGQIIETSDIAKPPASTEVDNHESLSPVLGSDFSIEDLGGENLEHYRYERQRDRRIEGSDYYQIAVYNKADNPLTAVAVKRHYVQKDRLVITRTDYFNEFGELSKQRSAHDLQPVSRNIWQPNMQFLNNIQAAHQSIIKIEERIFSADYLPANVFTIGWLLANHPPLIPAPVAAQLEIEISEPASAQRAKTNAATGTPAP